MDKRKTHPQTRSPRHRLAAPIELPNGQGRARNISNSGLFFELADRSSPARRFTSRSS